MLKKQILTVDDLIKISSVLQNNILNEYDTSNLQITLNVDEKTMKMVNENIFYSNNPNTNQKPEETDEILINVNNIHFKYVINEEEV